MATKVEAAAMASAAGIPVLLTSADRIADALATTEDGPEVGAGWKEVGEKAGDYISLMIDDPALPQPIRANLFQNSNDKTAWSLHWSRPKPRGGRG